MEERLQKLLSAAGVCSRRQAEVLLSAGRVTVNARPAHLGDKADLDRDTVAVDGAPISLPQSHTYLMLHKPRGCVTTLSDDKGRPTAAQLVADCGARTWPVGRLDYDSEGLLLFTDDGPLTHRLLHPSHRVEKEYHVTVAGDVDAALPLLRGPITLDGDLLAPARVDPLGANTLRFVISQGKNRQVRRMCDLAGLRVRRLVRVREGTLTLGSLPRGQWRRLTPQEVQALRQL